MNEGEISFITDKNGNRTHVVVPIKTYQTLTALKDLMDSVNGSKNGSHEIYTFSHRKISASGYPEGARQKPRFVVIKGSQAALSPVESLPPHVRELRDTYLDDGTLRLDPEHNCFVFTTDVSLPSPSFAASIVSGCNRSGLEAWVSREGFSLKQSGFGQKSHAAKRKKAIEKTKTPPKG